MINYAHLKSQMIQLLDLLRSILYPNVFDAMEEAHSKEELEAMITSENVKTGEWIREENQRKQTYRELIGSGDRKKIMRMGHTLYRHKADQSASGRKIHLCDENFLHDAEKLLIGEISIVLHLEPEQARDYIHKKLKEDA